MGLADQAPEVKPETGDPKPEETRPRPPDTRKEEDEAPRHIMLVEDNPGYREVIELTLADASDMQLDAVFGTAEASLQALQDTTTFRTFPILLHLL
jgi:hypothetical protein